MRRLKQFLRRTLLVIRVTLLEERVRQLDAMSAACRRYSKDAFLAPDSTRDERLDALVAWRDAAQYADSAEQTRKLIQEMTRASS